MRRSHTAVIERNTTWSGAFSTEPYEAGWASEAVFFVRALERSGLTAEAAARVQISPDGIHWCDEGTILRLPAAPGVVCARFSQFGGWLRLDGELPPGCTMKVIVYCALKE